MSCSDSLIDANEERKSSGDSDVEIISDESVDKSNANLCLSINKINLIH